MTRIVPGVLVAALALPGCYLAHERDPDASVPLPRRDAEAPDAPPRLDAGPPPPCTLAPEARRFVTSTRFAAHAPELGWDGERIGLVVFESDGEIPHPVVSWTRVSTALEAPALTVVGEESHSWGEAAWDPAVGFAVCWNGDPGGRSATRLRLRSRDGRELTPRLDLDPDGGACEGLARAGDRWGITWRHGRETQMRVGVVDDRGALVAPALDVGAPDPGGALITAYGDGFLVMTPHPEGVLLERIGRDGDSRGIHIVPIAGARYGALAAHDDGTLGIAARIGARDVGGLRFVLLAADLRTVLADTLLVVEGRGVRHPRLVPVPDGWAVLWVEQGDSSRPATAAVLAHLGRDGAPLEPRRALVDGENSDYGGPSLLWHERALYAAIASSPTRPGAGEQVELIRMTCEPTPRDRCAALDAASSGDDCTELTGFTWDGRACRPVVCGCAGEDCDRIAALEAECQADHAACD